MYRRLQKKFLGLLFLIAIATIGYAQPTITFFPTAGATNVNETTTITLSSNQTLRRDSDNANLADANVASVLVLKQTNSSGANIPFTATINAGDDIITITPNASLPSNTVIYVALTDVESTGLGGGALTPDPTFITFTVRDYSPPVITFSPLNSATNVAVASTVTITFDKAVRNINDSDITNANVASLITFKTTDGSGADVPFTATINAGKTVITITPTSSLLNNQLYYVSINPVEGTNQVATSASSITFTTTNDTQAPVPTFNPTNGSIDFINSNAITITFDEAIRDLDNSTFNNTSIDAKITLKLNNALGANIPFNATIGGGSTVVTITPGSTLPDFAVIYVAFNNVEDQFDNQITSVQSITFTTGDGTAPVITFNPANGDAGVAVGSNLVITFDEAVRYTNNSAINDADVAGLLTFKLTNSGGANVPFTATINAGKTIITINPTSDLNPDQAYYLNINPVENSYNIATSASSITFTTVDTQAPVATFNPVNLATGVSNTANIVITLNEPIRDLNNAVLDDTSIDGKINLKLTNALGANIAFNATIDVSKTIITIDPTATLPDLAIIYVAINNIEDQFDNQIVTPQSITFTTTDLSAPTLTFNPINGATSFLITQDLTITFNEAIRNTNNTDITDVNVDNLITFKLTNSGGANVGFDATINAGKTIITINPTSNLVANQVYYLSISPIEDLYNNATVTTSITFQTQELTANAGVDKSICTGESTTLSGSAVGGTGFYQFTWSGPGGFTSNSPTPLVSPTTPGPNVYTLTVTDSNTPTPNSDDHTVTITLNAAPTDVVFAPSGADAAFRTQFILSDPPYELAATGTPAGGTFVFSGTGVSIGPDSKYYFSPAVAGVNNNPITITCIYTLNGCSISETQDVNVNTNNSVVNNMEEEYCTADGQTPILTHNQSAFYWPTDVYTRMRIKVYEQKVFSFVTFTYVPYVFNGGLGEYLDQRIEIDPATYNSIFQEVPASNPKTYRLDPSKIPNLTGALFGLPAGKYSIAVFGDYFGVEYFEGEVVFTLKSTPGLPGYVAMPDYCVSDAVSLNKVLVRASGVITWYNNPAPSSTINGINNTSEPTFNELGLSENFTGTFTKYMTQTVEGCESAVTPVPINVFANPSPPAISDPPAICSGEALPDLTAVGDVAATQYTWYGSAGPNTPDLNTTYTPTTNTTNASVLLIPNIVVATTTFQRFVSQYVNGCQSTTATVDVVVKQTPSAPLASSEEYCLNEAIDPIAVTASGGATVQWFDELAQELTPINNPLLATAQELLLVNSVPNFYRRYVTQTTNGCQSESTLIEIVVNALPGVGFKSSADLSSICKSHPLINLVADPPNPQNGGGWSGTAFQALSFDLVAGTASLLPGNNIFQPGQSYTLTYTFIDDNTDCSNFETQTLTFLPSINASLTVGDACFDQFVTLTNTSVIVPNGSPATIESFGWEFGDGDILSPGLGAIAPDTHGGYTQGNHDDLQHKFRGAVGPRIVRYNMKTSDGCVVESQRQVEVNPLPVANFTWVNVCEGMPTTFAASTSNVPAIPNSDMTYTWNFNSEGVLGIQSQNLTGNGNGASVVYSTSGRDTVEMIATSDANCFDIVKKPVFIVPPYAAITETNSYTQSFEVNSDGWINGGRNSSWNLGTPPVTSPFTGNGQLWATNTSGLYNPNEVSWVLSRCFDFSLASKPVIALDIRADTPSGIDGAVLQYNLTGNIEKETDWKVLGTINSGINWYEQQGIASKPGSQTQFDLGWSGNAEDNRYPDWKHAVYKLDELIGMSNVVFRIAFSSTNTATREGFAFDNLFIGERSRIVLIENFTNSSLSTSGDHNDVYNNLTSSAEVVKIQYHTSFPGADALNVMNTSMNDARTAFYGLNSSLTLRIDGQYMAGNVATWAESIYNNRVLSPSPLKINFNSVEKDGDIVKINLEIINTTSGELDLTEAHINTAILEKKIDDAAYLGSSGNSEFEYVAREFLPTAAGIKINKVLAPGEIFPVTEILWSNQNLIDETEAVIAAFVQSATASREVYQAKLFGTPPIPPTITGVNPSFSSHISIYPNPSNAEFKIVLPERTERSIPVKLFDAFGRIAFDSELRKGAQSILVNTKELSSGVYLIKMETAKGIVMKKVIVVH